jgi:hypothetical protein
VNAAAGSARNDPSDDTVANRGQARRRKYTIITISRMTTSVPAPMYIRTPRSSSPSVHYGWMCAGSGPSYPRAARLQTLELDSVNAAGCDQPQHRRDVRAKAMG